MFAKKICVYTVENAAAFVTIYIHQADRMKKPKRLITFAKDLRQHASDAENKLWHYLRSKSLLNLKFRRQAVMGQYIVDFVCHEKKLVIELDGGQHFAQEEYDKKRSRWLEGEGYKVIRFDNNEFLKNVEGALEIITQCLMGR